MSERDKIIGANRIRDMEYVLRTTALDKQTKIWHSAFHTENLWFTSYNA